MATVQALNLNTDADFMDCQWFEREEDVFRSIRGMMAAGWHMTEFGLASVDENGQTVIARPVKIQGSGHFSGIAIWRTGSDAF